MEGADDGTVFMDHVRGTILDPVIRGILFGMVLWCVVASSSWL